MFDCHHTGLFDSPPVSLTIGLRDVEGVVSYETHRPADDLSPFIAYYYFMELDADSDRCFKWHILPDPTFHFFIDLSPNSKRAYLESCLPTYRRTVIRGRQSYVGVCCRIDGTYRLLSVPLERIYKESIPLEAVWPTAPSLLVEGLIAGRGDRARQVACLDEFFRRKLASARRPDMRVKRLIELISQPNPPNLGELSHIVRMSRSTLTRQSKRWVGLGPCRFRQLARFRHACRQLLDGPPTAWSDFAVQHGFSDQSHFVREFTNMTGFSPQQFLYLYCPSAQLRCTIKRRAKYPGYIAVNDTVLLDCCPCAHDDGVVRS